MAFGNVYVFNLYLESVNALNLNGTSASAGTIAAPASSTTPPWTPQQIKVARTNLMPGQLQPNQVLFCNGPNNVSISYDEGPWFGKVTIPSPPSPTMDSDLWLYIGYQKLFLFDTTGRLWDESPLASASGKAEEAAPAEDKGGQAPLGE